jgi:hypothetical protein
VAGIFFGSRLLMHAKGACIMQFHDHAFPSQASEAGCAQEHCKPYPSSAFEPDWHPHLGAELAAFPRSVELQLGAGASLRCWPDFATFIGDESERQMMYYPAAASEWWVVVGTGVILAFKEAELVARAQMAETVPRLRHSEPSAT